MNPAMDREVTVVPTLATLNLEEYRQWGRNSVHQCEATFLSLLLSSTSDPDSIEAAMRGRQDALGEVATGGAVRIVWRSKSSVTAAVRGPVGGIASVHWTASDGFSCSCGEPGQCCHQDAVRQTLGTVA